MVDARRIKTVEVTSRKAHRIKPLNAARGFLTRYALHTRRPGETEAEAMARARIELPSLAQLVPDDR